MDIYYQLISLFYGGASSKFENTTATVAHVLETLNTVHHFSGHPFRKHASRKRNKHKYLNSSKPDLNKPVYAIYACGIVHVCGRSFDVLPRPRKQMFTLN